MDLDGKKIVEIGAFRTTIAMKAPGSKINLSVMRDGQRIEIPVTLDKLPEKLVPASSSDAEKSSNPWGFSTQTLTRELAQKFGLSTESGIVITEVMPDSPAGQAGLEPGMVIQQINRRNINSMEDLNAALHPEKEMKSLLLLVSNGDGSRYVLLKLAA